MSISLMSTPVATIARKNSLREQKQEFNSLNLPDIYFYPGDVMCSIYLANTLGLV